MELGTVGDLHFVGFDLGCLTECFVGQVAPPPAQRADPCHLRLMRALMGQQGFVIAILGVDDDQALADGEASGEAQQAGVEDHGSDTAFNQPAIQRELANTCAAQHRSGVASHNQGHQSQ